MQRHACITTPTHPFIMFCCFLLIVQLYETLVRNTTIVTHAMAPPACCMCHNTVGRLQCIACIRLSSEHDAYTPAFCTGCFTEHHLHVHRLVWEPQDAVTCSNTHTHHHLSGCLSPRYCTGTPQKARAAQSCLNRHPSSGTILPDTPHTNKTELCLHLTARCGQQVMKPVIQPIQTCTR